MSEQEQSERDLDGSEVERLEARIRELELEQKVTRTFGRGLFGLGALLIAGPNLVRAFRAWYQARQDGKTSSLEETTQLSAAIVKRMFNVGLIGLLVTLLPIGLLFQQNRLLSKQNEAFARDTDIARRAQLISTLYDTDCSLSDYLASVEVNTVQMALVEPEGEPKGAGSVAEDPSASRKMFNDSSGCPPRADARSRAEAAKALFALDHPAPTWTQRLWWKSVDMPDQVRTDFTRAKLQGADLIGVTLLRANLNDADLSGAALSAANLKGASLFRANLNGTNLRGADLSDANFGGAHLRDASLTEADFSGAHLWQADIKGAHLAGANLYGANLSDADLSGAYLVEANLSDADLSGANLSGASLDNADLNGASLEGTDLKGANLGAARSLTQQQVDNAFGDSYTTLPSELKYPCQWEKVDCEPGASHTTYDTPVEGGAS